MNGSPDLFTMRVNSWLMVCRWSGSPAGFVKIGVAGAGRDPFAVLGAFPSVQDLFGGRVEVGASSAGAGFGREFDGPSVECLTTPGDREPMVRGAQSPQRRPASSPRRIPVVATRWIAG